MTNKDFDSQTNKFTARMTDRREKVRKSVIRHKKNNSLMENQYRYSVFFEFLYKAGGKSIMKIYEEK